MLLLDRLIWALAAAILAGMLSGCTTMETGDRVWFKQGGTFEERERLLAAAQVQSAQAHAVPTPGSPDTPDARKQTERQAVLSTMSAAGWQLVPKEQAGELKHEKGSKGVQRSTVAPTTLDR